MRSETPDSVMEWLLEGPAWLKYRARVDLCCESPVKARPFREEMRSEPQVQHLIQETTTWPWPRISSHKSAGHPLHKLVFLADIGLSAEDEEMRPLIEDIISQASEEGPFRLTMNVPKHFGGTGEDGLAWALCDSPSLTYALVRMGVGGDVRVRESVRHLASLAREKGFPCVCSKELGKFRGPGRKDDPCPYATLIMLKLLAETELRNGEEAKAGVECLLSLWKGSRERHPYQFYMGTDFRKLKAPFVWYDILHVADILTKFEFAQKDERLGEILSTIWAKKDREGRFTAESVWTDWNGWEFGQKKVPSRWVTLCAYRALGRVDC